jgi:streptogramin lyase
VEALAKESRPREFNAFANRVQSRRVTPLPAAVDLGGGHFPDITAGSGAVWVAHAQDSGGVDRVDPATGEAVEHIGLAWASAVAAGLSSIWAITAPPRDTRDATRPRLVEIDPAGNRIVGRAAVVGGEPSALAVSEDAVWVADVRRASVVRVDPRSHAVQVRIAVGRRPTAVAADGRIVWVLNHGDRSLMRIDPASNEPVGAPISLGKELEDIALARDGLWVAASDATLTRLDRLSGAQVGDAVNVGRPALKLAASPDEDGVWIASAADATVQRFGAL